MSADCDLRRVQNALREALPAPRATYGVQSLAIFGSTARGEAMPGSDVDILVRFEGDPPGLFELVRLERQLSTLLERPVGLVMETALEPRLREEILAEAVST